MVSVWFYLVGATYLNVEAVHPSIPLQPHVKRLFWIRSITRTNPKRNQSGGLEKRTYVVCMGTLSFLLTSNVWQIVGWGDCCCNGYHLLPVFLLLVSLSILESLYTGPHFFSENSGYSEGCVPIYPKTEYWETVDGNKKTTHSRTMMIPPLWLSYAWTSWKVQGQTIKSKVCCGYWGYRRRAPACIHCFVRRDESQWYWDRWWISKKSFIRECKKQRLMKERKGRKTYRS